MKKNIAFTLSFLFLIVGYVPAQDVLTAPAQGGPMPGNIYCQNDALDREALKIEHNRVIREFRERGILLDRLQSDPVRFIFPLRQKEGVNDPGFHGVANFVDHNPATGELTDFMGGTRTYDLPSGYNHQGTDYYLWPFNWNKVADDEVEVIAAAEGVILGTVDGNPDQNCSFEGAGQWNAVFLVHDDGSRTWYGHMKNGSVTTKTQGMRVEAGEYLGVVASSGISTGPHLHFEVYDADNNLIDPYAGPFNPTIDESWWIEQPDYYDSAINKLIIHTSPPQFRPCPQLHQINQADAVDHGVQLTFAAYYRDQLSGQISQYRILRPDGSVLVNWQHSSTAEHFASSYWYWFYTISAAQPSGIYTFEATYEGEVYTTQVQVGAVTSLADEGEHPGEFQLLPNFPNPFNPSTNIRFYLPEHSSVRLTVHDLTGREVALVEEGSLQAGSHVVSFNASGLASGVYLYRLSTGDFVETRKMVLVR